MNPLYYIYIYIILNIIKYWLILVILRYIYIIIVCVYIDTTFSMSTSRLRLLIQSSAAGVLLSFTRRDRPERMHVKLRPQEF